MSIFREPFSDSIQTQLKARTLVISGEKDNRDPLLPWYLGKNAWVRMTSFVNFDEGKVIFPGNSTVKIDTTKGNYKGDQLSRKYVLEGGTLYNRNNNNESALRYGMVNPGAAYGGNIDLSGNTIDPNYFRQMGIRPMPGITSVSLRTKAAYGSLFETTVNFQAWDTHQLNELEVLFMRPGYSVLLEWGWSQYLNYSDDKLKNSLERNQIQPESYIGAKFDPFDTSLTQQKVYDKLEALRKKYKHNYDGMLGYVKNFQWKLRKDGGYDCITTLISMGEVISTVKMNTNSNPTFFKDISNVDQLQSIYFYDDYENVLLSIKSKAESFAYSDARTRQETRLIPETEYSGSWDYSLNYIPTDKIVNTLKENKYIDAANKLNQLPFFKSLEIIGDNDSKGMKYEYIPLDTWIAILGSYCNLKEKNVDGVEQLVRLIPPGDIDYCLAGTDTISVDPSICIVKTPGAFAPEFSSFYVKDYNSANGINPPLYYFESGTDESFLIDQQNVIDFFDKTVGNGKIKNILLNISFLLDTYREMKKSSNESGVIMLDYMKNILNKVSNALGGLNNFITSTAGVNQNTIKIVDTYYLNKGPKDDFYEFDILGLGSILKDVDIQSQIFENQSTIVAIAAQSRANLGDVYNSTQVYLNAGLSDRLSIEKGQGQEISPLSTSENNPFFNNDANNVFYRKLVQLMVYARDYIVGQDKLKQFPIYTPEGNYAPPTTILKQSILRFDNDVNFKALIPFKLRITLEGIGGIVVGQIFRVKQNILPKNYYDKSLGFVITQINHELRNNTWETTLETQICLLEDNKFTNFNKLDREGFGEYIAKLKLVAILYPILYDFIKYQAVKSLVGYIYSSQKSLSGSEVIKGYLKNYDQEDVKIFWELNEKGFINQSSNVDPAPNGGFTNDRFVDFMVAWIDKYRQIYPEKLSKQFTEDTTLEQALSWISNKNYETPDGSLPAFYKGFTNDLMVSIQTILNASTDLYYPNNNPISLYYGDGRVPNASRVIKTFSSQANISSGGTAGVGGNFTANNSDTSTYNNIIDETGIRNGINNFFNTIAIDKVVNGQTVKDPLLKLFKDAYEIGLAVDGTAIPELFPIDSKVMFGDTRSLLHKEKVYWATGLANECKTTNIAFAKHINWDKQFNDDKIYGNIQPKYIDINRMGEVSYIGVAVGRRTSYKPLPSTLVSNFVNKNGKGNLSDPPYPWI